MANEFDHLPLPKVNIQLPRRATGGGGDKKYRTNRSTHGTAILAQISALTQAARERRSSFCLDPKLIFKVKLAKDFDDLKEEDLTKSGLSLLAREPAAKKAIVVFSSDEELAEFRTRWETYSGVKSGFKNDYLDAVESLSPLEPADRIGRLLELEPLQPGEIAALDLELWHTGDPQEMRKYIDQVRQSLRSRATSDAPVDLTDFYIGDYLCIARIKVNEEILGELLAEVIVKEIDRRPRVAFEFRAEYNLPLSDIPQVTSPSNTTCGILVVDSGVQRGHPLLAPIIGEAEVFPAEHESLIGPDDEADHGTGVAGIAAYGDIENCIRKRSFDPTAWVFSARVLNEKNEFNEDLLLENQLEQSISYFIKQYPNCRVINLSLGNSDQVYQKGSKQTRIAAKIDELAYRYQLHNVLFIVAAGNAFPYAYKGERDLLRRDYPNYLLNSSARIIDPATSAIALTVGALSLGRGSMTYPIDARRNAVARVAGYPSPFTRTGFGVDDMIKPDLVDFGGDFVLDGDRVATDNDAAASIVTFSQNYTSSLFKVASGTSFAAPRVANLAARLYNKYPTASPNLIRALLVTSAAIPKEIPAEFQISSKQSDKQKSEQLKKQLSIYGYGQPEAQRAVYSADNYVVLLEDHLDLKVGSFDLFEIPALPTEFLQKKGKRFLSITLAFDPPTRPTRGDSYLGITMEFDLFKGIDRQSVINTYVDAKKAQKSGHDGNYSELSKKKLKQQFTSGCVVNLKPGSSRRKKGTLQRGVVQISDTATNYGAGALYLVVSCNRKWVKVEEVPSQRYALVAAVGHSDPEVQLYNRLKTQILTRLRV